MKSYLQSLSALAAATALATFILLADGRTQSIAHENATGVVAERMTAMEAVGDAMKRLTAMFRGQVPYEAEAVRQAAGIIEGHGGQHLTRLFPEHSLDSPSEALPAIWQDWDRFESLAGDLSAMAGALASAANNPQPDSSGMGLGMGMPGGAPDMLGGQNPMMGGPMMGAPMMGGPMMGGQSGRATISAEALAEMPPQASFRQLSQVCNACHTRFRQEQ